MIIATSRYQRHQPSDGAAVRSTVGAPRFKLPYTLDGVSRLTAPTWAILKLPRLDFTAAYRARLDEAGVDAIRAELAAIAAAAKADRIVLLCFEDLTRDWCHRSIFAAWWHEQTGEAVDELAELPIPTLL